MIPLLFLFIYLLTLSSCLVNKIAPYDTESFDMNMLEQVKYHGYPVVQYKVQTVDGYILTLHRIPGRRGTALGQNLREMEKEPR